MVLYPSKYFALTDIQRIYYSASYLHIPVHALKQKPHYLHVEIPWDTNIFLQISHVFFFSRGSFLHTAASFLFILIF